MDASAFDPRRLDIAAFARAGGALQGEWPLAGFGRLLADAQPAPQAEAVVGWSAQGECRQAAGSEPQLWLRLRAHAAVELRCQRCLQPLAVPIDVDRRLRFVEGEAEAERLDADSDDDVLALEPALDLHALVEDELILALPLVPRHDDCSLPAGADAGDGLARAHPFAALEALRRRDPT
ncbi:MAG: DUF177 domain-containing protein [Proteobacteria bacterium]|nr:DUF177 domain-containing protein [Pseudomonadota bacterium]